VDSVSWAGLAVDSRNLIVKGGTYGECGWRMEESEVGAMGVRGKALFLDRDGVINHEVGYLHAAEDVRWVEGIFELCRVATGLGYKLVVVTNQAGIARGIYTEAQYEELTAWMLEEFVKEGAALDAVYYCPFHPEHGVGKYKREHEDRKPGTGMLRRAAKDLRVELGSSVMVGDRGTETEECKGEYAVVTTLHQVQEWLVVAAAACADEVAHGDADVDAALESSGE
jgi:D-glycero-D-manno-heptose 1,7-bisphosphate phosphatase